MPVTTRQIGPCFAAEVEGLDLTRPLSPEEVAAVASAVDMIRYIKEETPPCGQHLTRIKNAANDSVDAIFGGATRHVLRDAALPVLFGG